VNRKRESRKKDGMVIWAKDVGSFNLGSSGGDGERLHL
jgi:hypothetical protein